MFRKKSPAVIESAEYSVLFVCMGNICRSPTAEGVFRKLATDAGLHERLRIDSAGTHAYHSGEPPDQRARAAAERRGIDLGAQRARRVTDDDFEAFDLVIAMDRLNLETLRERADAAQHGKLRLLLEFASENNGDDVPDPYYGGASGFERVLDLVEDAASGLLAHVRRELG